MGKHEAHVYMLLCHVLLRWSDDGWRKGERRTVSISFACLISTVYSANKAYTVLTLMIKVTSEVAMASEATKMAIRGNMHMYIMVFEVTELNSEVISELQGHLETGVASEAKTINVKGDMHMDFGVFEVTEFKSKVKLNL